MGAHLSFAAEELGIKTQQFHMQEAFGDGLWYRRFARRLLDDRPRHGRCFNQKLQTALRTTRPRWLLTTGKAPVYDSTLKRSRESSGTRTINYSTDDPFNPQVKTSWYHNALAHYAVHASPRRANLEELKGLENGSVRYVPFGYNPEQHFPVESSDERPDLGDVLFVGHGDADRFAFFEPLVDAGLRPLLFGGGWNKNHKLRPFARGFADLDTQRQLYAQIPISVCLVRRVNRDGHVMRTFEAPAMKACLLMEDTAEQRDIFGEDETSTLFFSSPSEMIAQCKRLLAAPDLRKRLRHNAYTHIADGQNTYTARLKSMLES